jgi:hypothetical protein
MGKSLLLDVISLQLWPFSLATSSPRTKDRREGKWASPFRLPIPKGPCGWWMAWPEHPLSAPPILLVASLFNARGKSSQLRPGLAL